MSAPRRPQTSSSAQPPAMSTSQRPQRRAPPPAPIRTGPAVASSSSAAPPPLTRPPFVQGVASRPTTAPRPTTASSRSAAPRPRVPPPPQAAQEDLRCDRCNERWEAGFAGYFTAISNTPCGHLLCTRCTLFHQSDRSRCIICNESPVPADKLQHYVWQKRRFGVDGALRILEVRPEADVPRFPGALGRLPVDPVQYADALKTCEGILRGDIEQEPTGGFVIYIDLSLLAVHLVAFGNLLPCYLRALETPIPELQETYFTHIVAGLYNFLSAQVDDAGREYVDRIIRDALEPGVCHAMGMQGMEHLGFHRGSSNKALKALFSFTLTMCRRWKKESEGKGKGKGVRGLLRRMSGLVSPKEGQFRSRKGSESSRKGSKCM